MWDYISKNNILDISKITFWSISHSWFANKTFAYNKMPVLFISLLNSKISVSVSLILHWYYCKNCGMCKSLKSNWGNIAGRNLLTCEFKFSHNKKFNYMMLKTQRADLNISPSKIKMKTIRLVNNVLYVEKLTENWINNGK